MSDVTGSIIAEEPIPARAPMPIRASAVEVYGERYRANPKDADAALAYGQALRATGQRGQAGAVLEQATIANPSNKALLGGFGRALADNGNFPAGFRRPEPRPFARQSRLADPVGAGHRARSARPP